MEEELGNLHRSGCRWREGTNVGPVAESAGRSVRGAALTGWHARSQVALHCAAHNEYMRMPNKKDMAAWMPLCRFSATLSR